jgi:glycosyltransferase involved in cell wall biosynthesis
MACGVPVVATSSPGTRDIVSDGVDGILVQRHDASEVAAAIARVLSDPPFHARLAAAAKGKANAYETRAVAGAYDRAFVEALA